MPLFGFAAPKQGMEPVIVGYVFPRNQVLQPGQIDPRGLTRINYAFANIQDGRMVPGAPTDAQNLAVLTALRREKPSLTVLVSVGGWLGSNGFSDVALTAQSRGAFIESVMEFLNRYALDGLDVDWEYPGLAGSGHAFRREDKQNFTFLLKELRERFDKEAGSTGRRLYLTIAMGAFDDVIAHSEMAKVQQYVDTVNLMTYDYYEAGADRTTGNHAPLFEDPADPKSASADDSIRAFEKAGVPAEKILLGVPFYGRMWGEVPDQNHGLFQPGKTIPNTYAPYNVIVETMLNQGFKRYWDGASSAPHLYDPERHIFVSYEDPESLAAKCRYVISHGLGGVMFWEYFGDSSGQLLGAINQSLHSKQ
jgi:chitinase